MVTLTVNTNREKERDRQEREDSFRKEQRAAISSIVAAGHNFRRECSTLAETDKWNTQHPKADAAIVELLTELNVARLLVQDKGLQNALYAITGAWNSVCNSVDKLESEHKQHGPISEESEQSLIDSLKEFDSQTDVLYTLALDTLKPTISVQNRRKRRSRRR